jgi:hypothetical protein
VAVDPDRQAIQELAAQIMTGQLEPVEGARRIAAEADQLDDPGELACFADLARAGDDDAILEQTSLLLADTA